MWRSLVNVSALGVDDHEFESHRSDFMNKIRCYIVNKVFGKMAEWSKALVC